MKISVIMIDGGFREHIYSAEYFAKQEYDDALFEVFWVEFYSKAHPGLANIPKVQVVTLDQPEEETYHSSYCFNEGIRRASGNLIVIPDADQIVRPDFLSKLAKKHHDCLNLVSYIYRYDEVQKGALKHHGFEALEAKCILKNAQNYGGCVAVRKRWLLEMNGYEQHPVFRSGWHANGLDLYTRFKNMGLAIAWEKDLKLYHPWHPNTLQPAPQVPCQRKIIDWRFRTLQYRAINGLDPSKDAESTLEASVRDMIAEEEKHVDKILGDTRAKKRDLLRGKRFSRPPLFIHVPKVAGSSIEKALFGTKGAVGHQTALACREADPEAYAKGFSFAFVRNPYDRFVSAYAYLEKGGRNKYDHAWAQKHLMHYGSFRNFVLALRDEKVKNEVLSWMHFIPQYRFITDEDENSMVDFIGRYERLQADFDTLKAKLGAHGSLPHENASDRDLYQHYYDHETAQIIYDIYQKDFEMFGYEGMEA